MIGATVQNFVVAVATPFTLTAQVYALVHTRDDRVLTIKKAKICPFQYLQRTICTGEVKDIYGLNLVYSSWDVHWIFLVVHPQDVLFKSI